MDFSGAPARRIGFCFHARNHAFRTRWLLIAVVACGARQTRDDRNANVLLQASTAIRPPPQAALDQFERFRDALNTSTFGQWNPIEAATNGSKMLAAKAHLAGKALKSVAEVSGPQLANGDLSGALRAASNVLEDVQRESEVLDARSGPSGAVGILLVFSLVVAAWITELVLAKFFDHELTDADGVVQEAPKQHESRRFLYALNFARYLVAWHVVVEHFGLRGIKQHPSANNPWEAFVRWGILAAPLFFMLSGFCNSYSKLVGPEDQRDVEEDCFAAMAKRVRRWYPLFVIALTWCALRIASLEAEDWAHFMANSMLIHKLIWRQPTFPFVIGDFWLSWLIPYLLAWAPMHSALSSKADVVWTVFATAVGLTIPSAILEWYFVDIPLFNMLQLWPSFVFGQALAHWFVRHCLQEVPAGSSAMFTERIWELKPLPDIPLVVKFGVTLAALISGCIMFSMSPYDLVPLFNKPVTPLVQKGFQLPLQGLLVVGLAAQVDPVAKLFARRPLRYAEALTLTTFIFQAPVYYTIRDVTGTVGMSIAFTSSLIVFSFSAYFLLERPYRAWLGDRERGCSWGCGKKC